VQLRPRRLRSTTTLASRSLPEGLEDASESVMSGVAVAKSLPHSLHTIGLSPDPPRDFLSGFALDPSLIHVASHISSDLDSYLRSNQKETSDPQSTVDHLDVSLTLDHDKKRSASPSYLSPSNMADCLTNRNSSPSSYVTLATVTSSYTSLTAEKSDEDEDDEEEPDPRIQAELEKLNRATDAINSMETELENCRDAFRKLLSQSTSELLVMSKKKSESIEKARPYYEALAATLSAQQETQQATFRFERANSIHAAAKEMVTLAEEGLLRHGNGDFDSAWQETLNQATLKVNIAEEERLSSQDFHLASSKAYEAAVRKTKTLEKDLRRHVIKARPYFDKKARVTQQLEEQKGRVDKLEGDVLEAKKSYAESLHNLEAISNEIHGRRAEARRVAKLGVRGVGVGAEHSPAATRAETPSPNSLQTEQTSSIIG